MVADPVELVVERGAEDAGVVGGDDERQARGLAWQVTGFMGLQSTVFYISVSWFPAFLREAGFSDVALFYAGFSFRGWVAVAEA